MKEYPIIMTGNHPLKILNGTKTQTRRVMTKHNSVIGEGGDWSKLDFNGQAVFVDTPIAFDLEWLEIHRRAPFPFVDGNSKAFGQYLHVPYDWTEDQRVFRVYSKYEVGDRLRVKETWKPPILPGKPLWYKADDLTPFLLLFGWKSALYMPHSASRIL